MYMFGLLLLCVSALASTIPRNNKLYDLEDAENLFENFIQTYEKEYDAVEKQIRFEIFKQNLKTVNEKNANPGSAIFGITRFSDLTKEEFKQRHTGILHDKPRLDEYQSGDTNKEEMVLDFEDIPDNFDWRDKHAVSTVQDAGFCGSSWAFGPIGSLEGAYAIKYKKLLKLSKQQLIDCDTKNDGCKGGSVTDALEYLKQAGGVQSEKDYPLIKQDGVCHFDVRKVVAKVEGYRTYKNITEDTLRRVLYATRPIAVGIDPTSLEDYVEGVVDKCPGKQICYGALLTGYGIDNNVPYWTLKLSWGPRFGENGYVRVKRGVNSCGMMNDMMLSVTAA